MFYLLKKCLSLKNKISKINESKTNKNKNKNKKDIKNKNLIFLFLLRNPKMASKKIVFFKKNKGMFGNCFSPLFSVFKNNFLFFRLKNLFGNSKRAENKNCFQN